MKLYRSFFLTEETIKKFYEWVEKIRLQNSFVKNLYMVYEFEYKLNKVANTNMINDTRRINVLSLIEDKMNPIVDSVVADMLSVYNGWLRQHEIFSNMQDKEQWAKESYADVINNIEDFQNLLMAEYTNYSRHFTKAYKQPVYDLIMTLESKKQLLDFAKKYIYPMWYEIWKRSGMKETLKRISAMREELLKIDNKSFKDKQVIVNLALNTMHQTGSMKFHIANFLDTSEKMLDKLSNLSMTTIKKWDKDLIEMGIY